MVLDLLAQIRQRMLTPEKLRQWDADETFPEEAIRELLGPKIGLQLLFIPEEYGGMGGGARDIAAVSEEMAKICLGVATAFLAIHLGTDPILVGATDAQKEKWLGKLAEEGYGKYLPLFGKVKGKKTSRAVFGAGCFWHVQAAFGKWGSGLHLSQLFSKHARDK